MAVRIRSAQKKHRQSLKRRARNVHVHSTLKGILKDLRSEIEARNVEKSQQLLSTAMKAFDKAASKGIIHKKTASRTISRLSKSVYRLQGKPQSQASA